MIHVGLNLGWDAHLGITTVILTCKVWLDANYYPSSKNKRPTIIVIVYIILIGTVSSLSPPSQPNKNHLVSSAMRRLPRRTARTRRTLPRVTARWVVGWKPISLCWDNPGFWDNLTNWVTFLAERNMDQLRNFGGMDRWKTYVMSWPQRWQADKVLIMNGELLSGIVCKKTIGSSSGSLLHLVPWWNARRSDQL